jgi:CRISPR/Cas system-associated exonuclease Cas4 (RecB family)
MIPRKIFCPKELEVKIFIRKELALFLWPDESHFGIFDAARSAGVGKKRKGEGRRRKPQSTRRFQFVKDLVAASSKRWAHRFHLTVEVANKTAAVSVSSPRISVASTPDGADIEIDGSFVGNTPSVVELAPGDHVVIVTKSGYKSWQRKLKVTGGEIKVTAELEK